MEQSKIKKNEASTVMAVMDSLGCDHLRFGSIGLGNLNDTTKLPFFSLLPRMVAILSNYSCNSGDARLVEDVNKFLLCLGDICRQVVWLGEHEQLLDEIDTFLDEVHNVYNDK